MTGIYYLTPQTIDQARARTGCASDEQLAAYLGVSGGTVARARRGHQPSFTTGLLILKAAGADVTGIAVRR